MKLKDTQYARILIGGAALMIASAAVAEEGVVGPEIIVCFEGFHGIKPEEDGITEDITVEVIDEEAGDDEGEEILVDEEIIDDEELTDEHDIVICWDPDWVKRTNDGDGSENPEILYMTAGGPVLGAQGQSTSAGPEAADEKSAVTMVEAQSVTANIRRAAAKPTALKTGGRVFLR